MAIKPQHLLRSLLLIPYIAWGIALLFALLVSGSAEDPNTPNAFLEALAGLASVYTIAIIGWGIPATSRGAILVEHQQACAHNLQGDPLFPAFVINPHGG